MNYWKYMKATQAINADFLRCHFSGKCILKELTCSWKMLSSQYQFPPPTLFNWLLFWSRSLDVQQATCHWTVSSPTASDCRPTSQFNWCQSVFGVEHRLFQLPFKTSIPPSPLFPSRRRRIWSDFGGQRDAIDCHTHLIFHNQAGHNDSDITPARDGLTVHL